MKKGGQVVLGWSRGWITNKSKRPLGMAFGNEFLEVGMSLWVAPSLW